MGRLEGRRAIVTGAARGIGAGIAEGMAREGATVILADRDWEEAEAVAGQMRGEGLDARAHHLNVADEASWAALFAVEPGIDILVNNAGVLLIRSIAETSLEDFRRVSAINTDGVFLGIKHAFAAMGERGGAIVNLSSVCGLEGAAKHIAYCASKGAVRLMTKAAAIEAASLGYPIRCNSVHPGAIDTPMTRTHYKFGQGRGVEERIMTGVPSARIGNPGDVAQAVIYLASDDSAYVNGAELVIDGGLTAGRFTARA